jgi:DMSO/TMAO reductase YedYZ molybdopterin-dependent catalytic subunit
MDYSEWRPVLRAGAVAGLVAALVMTAAMALLREVLGIPATVELISDRLATMVGGATILKLLAVASGLNQLKTFSAATTIAGQLAVGALGGAIYAVLIEQQRERGLPRRWLRPSRPAVVLIAGCVVAWLILLAWLWPLLGANVHGVPAGDARRLTALGLLTALGCYGGALWLSARLLTTGQPSETQVSLPGGRRALVLGGAAVAVGLVAGGLVRRLYVRGTFDYDGLSYRGPDVQPITPNDRFYVVTKNLIDPDVRRDIWRLAVGGHVERPRTYDFATLSSLPATLQETTLQCISNGIGGGLISNAVWTGLPLRTLLEAAGPRPGGLRVVLTGADGYTDTVTFEKALDPATFVAYAMNGEPLSDRHGFPVRVIVPGLAGEKSVKWVTRVTVVDHEAKGFYERQGWGPNFTLQTHSRFDVPEFGAVFSLASNPVISLRGVAFAGDRGVARVQVSADGGFRWQDASLHYTSSNLTWVLWSLDWRPEHPGNYRLVVRATDGSGVTQPDRVRPTFPEGATGYHPIRVRVDP